MYINVRFYESMTRKLIISMHQCIFLQATDFLKPALSLYDD